MADFDDDLSAFDDLIPADDGGVPLEEATVLSAEEPSATVEAVDEVEKAAPTQDEAAPAPKASSRKLGIYLEWAAVACVPAVLLGVAAIDWLPFSMVIYAISVAFVPYCLWKGRQTNTVFTVILGCTLIAILTAVYFLWIEIGRYDFDIKARSAKGQASLSRLVEGTSRDV